MMMKIFNKAPAEPFLQCRSHMQQDCKLALILTSGWGLGQRSTNSGHIWSISVPTRKYMKGILKGKHRVV